VAVLSHLGPTRQDLAAVANTLIVSVRIVGAAMLLPAAIGLLLGEVDAATSLVIGSAAAVLITAPVRAVVQPTGRLTWSQAFTSAGLGWAAAAIIAAIPLLLSPNYGRPVHALVEAMAGLTTTGARLVQDIDHLAVTTNLWRHLLHPIGAVSALVVVATIRLRGEMMVATSTVAEAGEHRILPRHGRTLSNAVMLVALWSVVGTVVLTVLALLAGATPGRALLHGVTLATSAFSTGGFTLTSASAGALHSAAVQLVLAVLMIAGATSLILHRATATSRLREVWRELDVRVLGLTGLITTSILLLGLGRAGVYEHVGPLVRQGFFTLVAAHTTTGMSAVPPQIIATGWGDLAPAALVAAMSIGGMSGSIAGGVGSLRVGLIAKGIVRDVRTLLLPESALVRESYHQRRRHILTDQHVRASATILLLFMAAVFAGATIELATTSSGRLPEALFAATSAVSTTGLSLGFVGPSTPDVAVATSGLLMWFGRLEFLAVLAAFGLLARGLPGVGGTR
jgi:trk system potassium uptake protein TrkH